MNDFFERVYLINLQNRKDRLLAFKNKINKFGWPFKEPIIYPAISGDKVGVPVEFTQGGGAYGCRMSHLRILQDCLMEDVKSVLILEDDADIVEGFPEKATEFLNKVPDDWEGIMLGGQHHAPPIETNIPNIVRVRYCQRTHAYGARRGYMRALQIRWGNATVHIDWLMKNWQHQNIVYAPHPWLIGQAGGKSNISGRNDPPRMWNRITENIRGPVVIANVNKELFKKLKNIGFHNGYTINNDYIDKGLLDIFRVHKDENEQLNKIKRFIQILQNECIGGMVPTLYHPKINKELINKIWNPVYYIDGRTVEECLAQLPKELVNKIQSHKTIQKNPIILLRCKPELIPDLFKIGLHPGYYRHRKRFFDNGLINIYENINNTVDKKEAIKKWINLVGKQAEENSLLPCVVHPNATKEDWSYFDRDVIEISANSIKDIENKLYE